MIFRIVIMLLALGICFVIPFYFDSILDTMVQSMGIGWVFSTIYIRLMVVIFFAIFLNALFASFNKTRKLNKVWITFLIALGPGFGISMLHPIWQGDYGRPAQPEAHFNLDVEQLQIESDGAFETGEKQIVSFFTTGCPHCMATSRKLGKNKAAGMKLPVTAFFPGERPDAQIFIDNNLGESFDFHTISDSTFLMNAGSSFPVTFLIDQNGKTLQFWGGDVLSFNVLDDLLDME